MSVFNGERYLHDAIASILTQTFRDFEFIIIDDCSTDSSLEIIKEFASHDARIRNMTNDQNRGLAWSLNRGISSARGNFIARMDADDISLPDRLSMQTKVFQDNPEIDLVACAFRYIDESGKRLHQGIGFINDQYRLWRLQFHNVYIHSSIMFRKYDNGAYFYNEKIETAQDYDLWCRIAKKCNTKYLDVPLVYYRVSTRQISQLRLAEQKNSSLTTSFQNLRQCYPCLSQAQSQSVCEAYINGRLSLEKIKYILVLPSIMMGFFHRYEIAIRDRIALVLLVSKDILYWFRRNYFSR